MQVTNGFRLSQTGIDATDHEIDGTYLPSDIGGPMPIGSEYRWSVPVVSYAFDESFVEYFGAEGMHQVEAAFRVLNDVPSASELVPARYPTRITRPNYSAMAAGLLDLKSTTLGLVVEQLGLAQPKRSIAVLREINPALQGFYPFSRQYDPYWSEVLAELFEFRNYDPRTCVPSNYVNDRLYEFAFYSPVWGAVSDTIEFSATLDWAHQAVADGLPDAGYYFSGLSRDDIGGLRYLLNFTNVNVEPLLSDVRYLSGYRSNQQSIEAPVAASRPGRERIKFVRHPYVPKTARSAPLRYRFTDYTFDGAKIQARKAERVIDQPDILFCVDDGTATPTNYISMPSVLQTGTAGWINNAAVNGNFGGAGPGTIVPKIRIGFQRLGDKIDTYFGASGFHGTDWVYDGKRTWGAFGSGATHVTTFPTPKYLEQNHDDFIIRQTIWILESTVASTPKSQFWKLPVPIHGLALLQNSIDGTNWTTQLTITNNGGVAQWYCYSSNSAEVFRAIPK